VPGQALSGCSNTGNSVITVNLPFWDASTRAFATSQYYVDSSGNLRRCGPPILANGQLNHAGTRIDSILSSNANLVHGNATTDPAGSVAYTITLSDGQGNTLLSRTSRARAHGDLIDD
jgi:hypothetical protein